MPYARKVVLHCPTGYHFGLDAMVEQFINDGVAYVGVVGQDCSRVEEIIDELVVGDGSNPERFILTASHPSETLAQAVAFAESLSAEFGSVAQVVELAA